MSTTTLSLETVTPMFLRGSDNRSVELRPPAFKALFRYWWRAASGVTDVKELREKEGELFGSTKRRSPMSVYISSHSVAQGQLGKRDYSPVPHKDRGFDIQGYSPNGRFNLVLTAPSLVDYERIAKLSFLLGGVGNRSRRGFGSIRNRDWNFENVNELRQSVYEVLDSVSPDGFQLNTNTIDVRFDISSLGFPAIQAIYFGEVLSSSNIDLLGKIGQATHDYKDKALGGIGPRMASPIHVRIQRVADQYVPIVTQLHSVFPNDRSPRNYKEKQLDFIKAVIA